MYNVVSALVVLSPISRSYLSSYAFLAHLTFEYSLAVRLNQMREMKSLRKNQAKTAELRRSGGGVAP